MLVVLYCTVVFIACRLVIYINRNLLVSKDGKIERWSSRYVLFSVLLLQGKKVSTVYIMLKKIQMIFLFGFL